jgi:hypothetical protein
VLDIVPNNDTTPDEVSTGTMPTDRPSRYGKQIVSHLGRRALGVWSDETNTGAVTFDNGVAVAEFACEEDALTIALRSNAELIPRFESVVGDHLVRFGVRDELIVSWTRSDGSAGSVQSNALLNGHEPR